MQQRDMSRRARTDCAGLTVVREFEQDRARCVRAILRILGYRSPRRRQEQQREHAEAA